MCGMCLVCVGGVSDGCVGCLVGVWVSDGCVGCLRWPWSSRDLLFSVSPVMVQTNQPDFCQGAGVKLKLHQSALPPA